jgi:hypothetical protein
MPPRGTKPAALAAMNAKAPSKAAQKKAAAAAAAAAGLPAAPLPTEARYLGTEDVEGVVEWLSYEEPAFEKDALTGIETERSDFVHFNLIESINTSVGVNSGTQRTKTAAYRNLAEFMNNVKDLPNDWEQDNAKSRYASIKAKYRKAVEIMEKTGEGVSADDQKKGIETIQEKIESLFYDSYESFMALATLFGDRANFSPQFPVDEGGEELIRQGPGARYQVEDTDDDPVEITPARDDSADPPTSAAARSSAPSTVKVKPFLKSRKSSKRPRDSDDDDEEDDGRSREGSKQPTRQGGGGDFYTALVSGNDAMEKQQRAQLALDKQKFLVERDDRKEERAEQTEVRKTQQAIEERRLEMEKERMERQLRIEEDRFRLEESKGVREEAMLQKRLEAEAKGKVNEALLEAVKQGKTIEEIARLKELMTL